MRIALAAMLAAASLASAQGYPSGPVRMMIGYPPGGSADFTARVVAEEMAKDLGAAVIVENKPGAGTTIAATQSVLAGDTQILFATSPSVMGFIKAGRLKPLVVAMRSGSPAIPGVPGSAEAGLPDFESTFWFGIFAPAGTPAPVVARLHKAAATSLAKPELRARIESQGMDATPSGSPQAFAAEVADEGPRLERLVQSLGAKVE